MEAEGVDDIFISCISLSKDWALSWQDITFFFPWRIPVLDLEISVHLVLAETHLLRFLRGFDISKASWSATKNYILFV